MPYADSNGVRIYYEATGHGAPIVFVHEYCDDYRSWEDQVRHFSRRYRCITFNARGFAPSDAPAAPEAYSQAIAVEDLHQLMQKLDIEPAHVVGSSMGSMTALHFGLQHPERARSLVVVGTGPGHSARAKERFDVETARLVADIEKRGWAWIAKSYVESDDRRLLPVKNPRGCSAFVGRLVERSVTGPLQVLRRVVVARPLLADLADELRAMRVPTLIAVGDEDHVCIDTALFLERLLPAARLHVFPATGHTINLEEPERFNEAISDFFDAVERKRWLATPPASRTAY